MAKINKALLISINDYQDYQTENYAINQVDASYNTQDHPNSHDRITGFKYFSDVMRENVPEIELTSQNVINLLKVVKNNCQDKYTRFIISCNAAVGFTLINEEEKATRLVSSIVNLIDNSVLYNYADDNESELRSKYSMKEFDQTKNRMYQVILNTVRVFNQAILLIRKLKIDSMLNKRYQNYKSDEYYHVDAEELRNMVEKPQKLLYQVIESLTDESLKHQDMIKQSNEPYHSGDFRMISTYQRSPNNLQSNSIHLKNINFVIGYSYY